MIYSKEELRSHGLVLRGIYQGPFDLPQVVALHQSLSLQRLSVDSPAPGEFAFGRLVIVRQEQGFNIVEMLPPGHPGFAYYSVHNP